MNNMNEKKDNTHDLFSAQPEEIKPAESQNQEPQIAQPEEIKPADFLSKESNEVKNNTKWYIPLNRHNLSKILAGGVIVPSESFSTYKLDAQSLTHNNVLLVKDGVSSEMIKKDEFSGASSFLTLIEVELRELNELFIKTTPLLKDIKLYGGSIPTAKIKCIHFESEDNLEDFKIRTFDDVVYNTVDFKVSSKLFSQNTHPNFFADIKNISLDSSTNLLIDTYKTTDAHLGGMVMLMHALPASKKWFNFAKNIYTEAKNKSIDNIKDIKEDFTDIEQGIFREAFKLLIGIDGNKQWNGRNFLKNLDENFNKEKIEKSEIIKYDLWLKVCFDILDNKIKVHPLTDSKNIVFRAITLIILRDNLKDLLSAKNSSLQAGDEVTALAAILVGAKLGFQRLSSADKAKVPVIYSLFSQLKSNFFNKKINKEFIPIEGKLKVNLKTENFGYLGTTLKLTADREILAENQDEGPQALSKILADSNTAPNKIDFDVDRDNQRLIHEFELHDGRTQTIYITVGEQTQLGEVMVRITSPFLDLSKIKNPLNIKLINEYLQKKYNINLGDLCTDLIIQQGLSDLHCRYSIDLNKKYMYVLRDYPLSSSRFELEQMKGVAQIADSAEQRFNSVDTY